MKEKREGFRKYLETSGAIDKLTNALMKLYQEGEKPENSVVFIRKELGDDCPPNKIKLLEEEVKKLQKENKILVMEKNVAEAQIKRSSSDDIKLLMQGYQALVNEDDDETVEKSLLMEYLTEELFEKLKDVKTPPPFDGTLYDQIQSGLTVIKQDVGIFASDPKAFDAFDELFNAVLEDLHDIEPGSMQTEMDLGDSEGLDDLDAEKLFVQSIKITINRSLNDYAFLSLLTSEKLECVEKRLMEALLKIEDEELKGIYYSYIDIDDEQLQKWVEDGTIFPPPEDEVLKAAQTYRMWPKYRGLYFNEKNNFRVWVNAEEHLQIVIHEDGGNLKGAYERLIRGINFFGALEFSRHPNWGFLAHNLKNIGTTMRISLQAKLPKLANPDNAAKLEALCDVNNIVAEKTKDDETFELRNLKKFGKSEIQLIKDFHKGVKEFIEAEKCLNLS